MDIHISIHSHYWSEFKPRKRSPNLPLYRYLPSLKCLMNAELRTSHRKFNNFPEFPEIQDIALIACFTIFFTKLLFLVRLFSLRYNIQSYLIPSCGILIYFHRYISGDLPSEKDQAKSRYEYCFVCGGIIVPVVCLNPYSVMCFSGTPWWTDVA